MLRSIRCFSKFSVQDPFLLSQQLTGEELFIQDTARKYAKEFL